MEKRIVSILIIGILLTACAKDEYVLTAQQHTDAPTVAASLTHEGPAPIDEKIAEDPDSEETPVEAEEPDEISAADAAAAAAAAGVVQNDFFSAHIKEFEIPAEEDGTVRVVFEFTNITDKTFYKNDEEIIAGGTWEKIITYPLGRWKSNAEKGTESWIHYDLYEDEDNQEQIYKGGLKFCVAKDLSITGIGIFED